MRTGSGMEGVGSGSQPNIWKGLEWGWVRLEQRRDFLFNHCSYIECNRREFRVYRGLSTHFTNEKASVLHELGSCAIMLVCKDWGNVRSLAYSRGLSQLTLRFLLLFALAGHRAENSAAIHMYLPVVLLHPTEKLPAPLEEEEPGVMSSNANYTRKLTIRESVPVLLGDTKLCFLKKDLFIFNGASCARWCVGASAWL